MRGRHCWLWLALLVAAVPLPAREVPVVLLHTCDLHGHILPTEDYEGNTNRGGLARCAAVIRQIRATEKNVLLLDAGDTIQGSAVAFLTEGQALVRALNLLRYDAWILGNHEFDWGLEKLAACLTNAVMPVLNANVGLSRSAAGASGGVGPAAVIASRLQPYCWFTVDGVRVAVIGLNSPGVPNWSRPRLIAGLEFRDSVQTLREVVPAVRVGGAQIIVLVCHQGYKDGGDDHANQLNAIARNFPELDVIIGAHTHRNYAEYKLHNILYCQAGYYGIHLGRVDLVYDTTAQKLISRRATTLLMDESVPMDRELLDQMRPELERAAAELRTVVGQTTGEFWVRGGPQRETPVHNLFGQAIAAALRERGIQVTAVVHGLLDRRATLPLGAVTMAEVWKLVPYENTVGVLHLTPAELIEVLEENAAAYQTASFRGLWGLRWTFDPAAPAGSRTVALCDADGRPLDATNRIAVAFNSYDLASGGTRWLRLRALADQPDCRLIELDFQTRQAVVDYLRQRSPVAPVTNGWWRVCKRAQR